MAASLRSAQRLLGTLVPHVRATDGPGPTLETLPDAGESPRLVSVRSVEGSALRACRVSGAPEATFGGFLDGIQASRVVAHCDGFPIIHGTAAAVIRARRNRRLVTWGRQPPPDQCLYVPRAFVPASVWDGVSRSAFRVVDTTAVDGLGGAGDANSPHPAALVQRAIHLVHAQRRRLERTLAERWCASERAPLYIDGGISGSDSIATAACSVGVVNQHRTLYVSSDGIPILAMLAAGERTTAFRIAPARRTPVISWYLRLRDASGRDPTWGLVRVEVADLDQPAVAERANEVSRWVLAETAPLALPDPRWHGLAYGVRDCEEFLRATI